MISFIDPGGELFLANLTRIQRANDKVQLQVTSGFKVTAPDDAPDQVSNLLQFQAQSARNTQVMSNLAQAQAGVNLADGALTNVLHLVDDASSLGAQALSVSADPEARRILAARVSGILDQVVSASQTQSGDRYVFSGDSPNNPAYTMNLSSPNGVNRLMVATNTVQVQDSNGGAFSTRLTANEIFDHRNGDDSLASDNLFAALTNLYNGLMANNDDSITTAVASLNSAGQWINQKQGFYGASQNRLEGAVSQAQTLGTSLSGQISEIRETNIAEAAIQLTMGATQLQAALTARSQIPKTSLFDFLG